MSHIIPNRALRELNHSKKTKSTPIAAAPLGLSSRPKIASNVLELIGNTPMVKLNRVTEGCGAEVIVKLESRNPGGSVKDRIAMNMILEAEKRGEITPGKSVLVEATAGNTGIGLAMIAAARGYELILTMADSMSLERRVILKAYGAKVVLTPGSEGAAGVIKKAEQIGATMRNAVMVQQFSNPANPQIHYLTTGPEIWRDTDGSVDIFVSAVGTGGTLTGCGGYLKAQNPALTIAAVEPAESAVLSGGKPGLHKIQGIGAGFVPENCNTDLIDEVVPVSSDEAMAMSRRLVLEEGIFCGISAGAAVAAAVKLGLRPENSGKRIVAIIPDYGERYLSTSLFSDLMEEAKNQTAEAI